MTLPLPRMSLVTHLAELRRRLSWCLGVFSLGFVGCYTFSKTLLYYFARPLTTLLPMQEEGRRFIYTGLAEAFLTHLKIGLFGAAVFSFPFWAYQVWRFISPGLYGYERPLYRSLFTLMPLLFLAGAGLCYGLVCPWAWSFFLSFETMDAGLPLQFEARISEYIALTIKLMTVFGLGFQIPVILGLGIAFRWLSLDTLKRHRKYAFLIITIIAAIITPPDLISPLCLMIPVYGLYELSIAWFSLVLPKIPSDPS